MQVTVNLSIAREMVVRARVLVTENGPFIAFDMDGTTVLIPNADCARRLASELHRAADRWVELDAKQPSQLEDAARELTISTGRR